MNFNEYQKLSRRTMPNEGYSTVNYALGLVSEAGEVGDIIKKEVFHGHERDALKIKDELGDVLHYLSGISTYYGINLEDVAHYNIGKLESRYPEGFSQERSINRRGLYKNCEHCGESFKKIGRRKYCSDSCKSLAYQKRKAELD